MDKKIVTDAYASLRKQDPWFFEGSKYSHHRVLPYATYAPWLDDELFLEVLEKINGYTLVDKYRLYELWSLAKQINHIEGDVLEVGVWRGGSGFLLAEALASKSSQKKIYLADTFSGVVKAGNEDTRYKGGEHSDTSYALVNELMSRSNYKNYALLQGIFPDDTAHDIAGKISLLHCDVDVYDSAKGVVKWAIERMVIGSILVFDDYGFYGCEGVTKYCDELTQDDSFIRIHNLNGHAIFVKIR